MDSRIDATATSAVARTHVATKSAAQGTDDAANSATANFAVRDQSLPLGWTLLGAASAKLWSTLKCVAQKG